MASPSHPDLSASATIPSSSLNLVQLINVRANEFSLHFRLQPTHVLVYYKALDKIKAELTPDADPDSVLILAGCKCVPTLQKIVVPTICLPHHISS